MKDKNERKYYYGKLRQRDFTPTESKQMADWCITRINEFLVENKKAKIRKYKPQ